MNLTKQHWLLIGTLSLLTFVLGTSEFVIVGILTDLASDLQITNAKAGTLVSAFAITFAICTPIVMAITNHFPKRQWMLGLIMVFIALNAACIFTSHYLLFLILRMLTAIVTGVLISLAMVVASEVFPQAKRGFAISCVFGGFTLANVIGVPIGTSVAEAYSWNATFIVTTALGCCALLAALWQLPTLPKQARGSIAQQFSLLIHPRMLMAFFIPALGFGATYAIYTYLVPILKSMQIAENSISLVLFGYGFISILSNILAGKIASHNGIGRLRFVFLIQSVVLLSLFYSTNFFTLGLINIGLMSLMAILLTTSTQLYLIDLARVYQPNATGLAASLAPVASNVGIALGSAVGGLFYHNVSLKSIIIVGAIIALLASLLTTLSYRLDRKQKSTT
ncbi:inner membrane transport protein [Fictibacillus macauensis ZFHKF-1]|uniref:Inner membrane transport protein n=1 Tax=Fictibacillus macauensis ZFHKF-1 TaxID=1196324 RepID=I8J2V0_9BACL|nr:MFS transporter [Fictibacillus macauensis]EIT86076.1 inner membrane transport protein [Fictibacillus macauensis ZFHKF-1]